MPTYSLTAEGYAYYEDAVSKAPIYLCGARITHSGWAQSRPTIKAYYSADEGKRLTIWEWYTAVCKVVTVYDVCVPMDTIVGTDGWRDADTAPWYLTVGNRQVVMLDPLRNISRGIFWCDDNGTPTEATPESLLTPKPVLKPQSLYEYAFKVGTLCSMGTTPPEWEPLIPVLTGALDACIPTSEGGMKAVMGVMGEYYRAGTLCKVGTQVSDFTGLPLNSVM